MKKADLIAGVAGRPTPFDVNGFTVHLRPLTAADRVDLLHWYKAEKERPGAAHELQHKLVALAVADPETGEAVISEREAGQLPATAVDAISEEVARRNGFLESRGGKASRPTPSTPESADSPLP